MVFTADTDRDEKQAACEIFRAAAPVAANVRTTLEHLRPIIPPDLFERFVIGLAEAGMNLSADVLKHQPKICSISKRTRMR